MEWDMANIPLDRQKAVIWETWKAVLMILFEIW